jgi:hypothetical protein
MRQTTTAGARHDAMTKSKQQVLCPTRREPSIPLPAALIAARAFAMGRPKPNNGARLSRNPRKLFPKCELPHTSQPIPERCCFASGQIGAFIWRMPVKEKRRSVLPHSAMCS